MISSQTELSKFLGMKLDPIPSTLCGPGLPPPKIEPSVSTATACTAGAIYFVANGAIEILRNEARSDPFHLVRTGLAASQDRAFSLHRHGVHLRQALFQKTGNSGKSSGRAAA